MTSWPMTPIGAVCRVIAGQSPPGNAYNDQGDGLPFYQGKKEFTERYLASPSVWTSYVTKRAEAGDILMSVRAPVGPINEAREEVCIGRGLAALRHGPKIEHDYLWYALSWLQPEIAGNDGAVFPSINKQQIEALEIPLPPLDEQKRIVAVLDHAFAALDHACANAEANLLSSTKLPDVWLRGLFEGSEAWPTQALAAVCENLDRLRVPITKGDREPGDVPYYGASGIVDHVRGHIFDEELLLVSEDGANLLTRTYPIAFSISGKAWVNNHAHVLRFNDSTTQEFVRLYLSSISLKPYVTGMAQPKLNQAALSGIPVPMPVFEVRDEIVRKAHQISVAAEHVTKSYRAQSDDIAALRQSLLQAAFCGQLT